ncbi:MAG: hypothetical protein ABFS45_02055 [Pseudomonadota bacterium]
MIERSVLQISYYPFETDPPIPLELGAKKTTDASAPRIFGAMAQHIVLSVNGMECHNVKAVPTLLPQVNGALREYL